MKPFHGVIKILLQINVLTAIIALVSFVLVREHQSVIPDSPTQLSNESSTYRRAVKEDGEGAAKIERARQLEGEMKQLQLELAQTRHKVQDLLSRSPRNSPGTPQHPRLADGRSTTPYLSPLIASLAALLEDHPQPAPVPPSPHADRTEVSPTRKNPRSAPANRPEAPRILIPIPIDPPKRPVPSSALPKRPDGNGEREPVANLPNLRFSGLQELAPLQRDDKEDKLSIRYANDIAVGLLTADRYGQINYGTKNYRRIQTAIRLLRQGEDIEVAARRSAVSVAVLQQLIRWGENRPGNLASPNEIGLVNPDGE